MSRERTRAMSEWHRNHPDEAEEIARLPLSQQNAAERAAIQTPLDAYDLQDPLEREVAEAERLHDQHPGRWGDHASPARMRRDLAREREDDRGY